MARIILITGGTRSGKSAYALERAEAISPKRLFVATCPCIDPEMEGRIARHRQERKGRGWTTLECDLDLASVFQEPVPEAEVVLIDCLTLWVNNVLHARGTAGAGIDDRAIGELCSSWLGAADGYRGTVIVVTNEVGLGIVPENSLARKYRDLVGTCNQVIGKKAGEVVLVCCGIPLVLKSG